MRPFTGIAVLAMASLLAVSACSSGGGDPDPDPDPMVRMDPTPRSGTASPETVKRVRSARATEIVDTTAQAAVSPPRAGSVYQSAAEGLAGISGIGTSFDGADLNLTVSRADGSSMSVGSDYAFLGPYEAASPVDGHHKVREWGVARADDQGISIARVLVSWDEGDSTDYLAGGYWMHLAGDVDSLAFDGIEIGAFVDGPELSLSSPPDMPVQGGARYDGPTGGLYTASHAGDTGWAPGSLEIGEFQSTIHLNVDFAAGTIGGCVGCVTPIALSSVLEDGATGELYELDTANSGYRLDLYPTTLDSDGTFDGDLLSLSNNHPNPDYRIAISDTDGAWGGQFSNIPDSGGDPRLVAGTYGAAAETARGSQGVFLGAFLGAKRNDN